MVTTMTTLLPTTLHEAPRSIVAVYHRAQHRSLAAETECSRFCCLLLTWLIEIHCRQQGYQLQEETDGN